MPFNQNINYIQVVGAIAWLLSLWGIGMPPNIQQDLLVAIPALMGITTFVVHTFINHPANVQILKAKMISAGVNATAINKVMPVLLAGLLLASCTTTGTMSSPDTTGGAATPDQLQQLASFTLADLQTADADAVANGDDIAHACYPVLEAFIQNLPNSNSLTTVKGAFSAFQKARDFRNATNAGVPTSLIMGCGPLYAQVHGDILKFLANAGIAASPIPLLPLP